MAVKRIIWFVLAFAWVGCSPQNQVDVPPTPTRVCAPASLTMTASATIIQVGEPLTLTVTADNTAGCYALGIPSYSLHMVAAGSQPVLQPSPPEPIRPQGAVGIGQVETVAFVLQGTEEGQVAIRAQVSYEYALGSGQPFTWGGLTSETTTFQVHE